MLEITFLGTSGSTPTIERSMPAIAIKHEGNVYLFDCGEGTQRQIMKYRVGYGSLKAIFISHLHLDHFLGVYGIIETLHLTSPCPKEIHLFAPAGIPLINNRAFLKLHEISSGELLNHDELSIRAFPVRHGRNAFGFVVTEKDKIKFNADKAHGLGMKGKMFNEIQKKGFITVNGKRIKLEDVSYVKPGLKVVYSGDCAPSKRLIEHAKNADLLIHDGMFGSEHKAEAFERSHSTVEDAAQIAKDAGVKQLVLTHISPRYPDTSALLESAKKIFNSVLIAHDGLRIFLK